MAHFEFLHDSEIPWDLRSCEYYRKIILTKSLRKARTGRDYHHLYLCQYVATPAHSEEQHQAKWNHHHSFIRISILYFATFWYIPSTCSGCDSGIDLVVVLEYTLVPYCSKPRKSRRFKRFRRSYVHHPVVVSTNHCQSFNAFSLVIRCS